MENTKNEIAYLEGVVGLLDETCLARIDFDELRTHLERVCVTLRDAESQAAGQAILRQDFELRIGGMIKAIAAVDRKRERWEEAAALVDELATMMPERLLETHRRVVARFRDCFPGSFGPRNFSGRRVGPTAR